MTERKTHIHTDKKKGKRQRKIKRNRETDGERDEKGVKEGESM